MAGLHPNFPWRGGGEWGQLVRSHNGLPPGIRTKVRPEKRSRFPPGRRRFLSQGRSDEDLGGRTSQDCTRSGHGSLSSCAVGAML